MERVVYTPPSLVSIMYSRHALFGGRQYLASLQIDPDRLLPEFDQVPDILVEKCAAVSIRPETMKQLTSAMQGMIAGL